MAHVCFALQVKKGLLYSLFAHSRPFLSVVTLVAQAGYPWWTAFLPNAGVAQHPWSDLLNLIPSPGG